MDRPTMPPAHRDVPDDITPPGHEPVKYVVGPGDLTRGELRRLLADAGAGAAELSNLSRDDLVSVAKARKLEGLEVSGTGAVEARARDFLAVFSRLDRTVALPPGAELGLVLEKVGEWCVVAETPQTTAVRVGDVLSEVDGVPCLLEAYDDTFKLCAAARRSRVPYTLTFRRAPFHKGWLRKKARGRSSSRFSGLTGWKRRFFVLRSGKLTYYAEEPPSASPGRSASKPKGSFSLARQCTVNIRETDGVLELALTAANDRLVMRGADGGEVRNWAALCTVATAHATGGTALLRDYERERLGVERREAERREQRRRANLERREMFRRQASERASLAAAQARRDALHSSTSSDLLPEYKSEPPPPPLDTPPSRGSSYRLPECSPAYAEPPPVTRATSAEELRERFRNVGLSDLSP